MRSLVCITCLFNLMCFGQPVKVMDPALGNLVDKSVEGEIQFIRDQDKCEAIWKKMNNGATEEELTMEEKRILGNCSETVDGYWDILGAGCSWYCGGGPDSTSASSELNPYKAVKYSAGNIHDLNYRTAWIEGVPGYGIGEYVIYHFSAASPRITKIIVVNGYVKSKEAWEENSRVKKLKMYLDNKPFAILNLEDSREEQTFTFEPIGRKGAWEVVKNLPGWTMRFEIMEVYKGTKYMDTAITEIYFDGIDVH